MSSGKGIPGRGNGQCKGPEVGTCLVCAGTAVRPARQSAVSEGLEVEGAAGRSLVA